MLTQKQHQIRKTGLGGSDIAAICGLSPWTTPLEVYLEKTGSKDPNDQPYTDAMYFGDVLEDIVANEYSKRTGYKVSIEPETLRHPQYDFMLANIDRWAGNKDHILECKTTSGFNGDQWGHEGTDQIPNQYLTQVAWYAAICNAPKVDIAVLIGGNQFKIYTYTRNYELEGKLINAAHNFWYNHVLAEKPPKCSNDSDVSYMYANDNGDLIQADDNIYNKYHELIELKDKKKDIEDKIKSLTIEIQEFMGQCSKLTNPQGETLATWNSVKPRKTFDSKALQGQHPDLYEKFLKETKTSRRFTLK